jgi:PAS domain S-box-containing protein
MHRPQSTADSTPPVQLWLRTHGWPSLILAVVWAVTGRISFLLNVDHVLVTPAFFFPEAFSLAFALRFGAGVWPGIFVGHQLLILGSGLPVWAGLGVSAANTLEAVLAVWLFRRLQGKSDMDDLRSWVLLQAMVFLVLQPFCATLGTGSLLASGVIGDGQAWLTAGLNWWSGSGMAQSQLAPLLLVLLHPRARVSWAMQIVIPAMVTAAVLAIALFVLGGGGVGVSLVLFQPLLVAFGLLVGLPAVCVASVLVSVAFLYATSHGWGPFYLGDATSLFDLNVFLIGISLIGQFLAVLFRQLAKQRETEEELRADRERLQRTAYELTENIPVGTYVLEFDEKGEPHFTFLSERFLTMTGLRREEVMANHALALQPMSAAGREEISRLNRDVFDRKQRFLWEGEMTVRGEKRNVTLESVPRDRPGGGTIWEGVLTDITERKAAEEKIARSEAALRNALNTLPFAVGMCGASPSHADPEARIVFLNRNFVETFGYTLADLPTAAAWANAAYPDETRRREVFAWWDQAVRRLMGGQSAFETHESRAVTKRGLPLDIVVSATMLEDKLIISFLDITERKKAEAQLQRVLDNLPIAVAATTLTSPADLTFINEEFTRTFGYTLEEVPTVAAWAEKAYQDPAYRREVFRQWDQTVFRAIETKGSVESMEFEVTCKDSTKRNIIFRAVALDDSLLISMTDVTERKTAEKALRSLREQLERTALELTENIPVGTYTMVQPPDGGMAYFLFMSTRFLELTGLEREEAQENPMNAFACVHPDDHEKWVRKNAYVFEHKLPFKEECRIVVQGETRWIVAESSPRDLPDGSVVWEGVLTDITDRKLAEQKVAASEARLRKILDNIPVPVAINDATKDGHITFLNEAFTRTFGYTPEDLPNVGAWARHAYPDETYRAATFKTWDAAVAEAARTNGTVAPMEFRVHAKDGSLREVLINAVALENMLLVGFVDITARKKAEEEVAAAHRDMQLTASAARLGFWELDVDTGLDHWDEEMARINGIRLADFDGHWEKFIHPDDYDEVMRETRHMLEADNIFGMEYRLRCPNGEVRHVRERGIVTRDDQGRALRVNGVLQDISEEKEAAEQLKQTTQSMQLAAAAAGIGFWSRDLASHIEQWDDQMLAIYGVRREDFGGRWELFVHPDDLEKVQESTEQALLRGVPGRYEYRIIRPDGTERHLRGMSVAIRDTRGGLVREIGVNFDITEEKEANAREKQLEAQHRRDLETKLKTSLTASVVAHEINQPLSAILLQSKMALQQGENASEALHMIVEEAGRVVVTIDKMKTLLRSVQTEQRGIDLAQVVQSALLYNKGLLARHHITLRTIGLDQPHQITGDDAQLQLAITNLLRNAVEAVNESSPLRREILVELVAGDNWVEFVIGDTGRGWTGTEKITTPLTTTKIGGTGIGLYVVRTTMENHRGSIHFGRSPLGGAEVRLRFVRNA